MPTIEELERKIEQLERDILAEKQETELLVTKANKAIDYALHGYKVDHYGVIWEWDTETLAYVKTKMRISSPTIRDKALESRHIADNAIEGRMIADNAIEGRMIKLKTIDGRSLKDNIIGPELIEDGSIPGDRYQEGAIIPGKLADNAVSNRNLQSKCVTPDKISDKIIPVFVTPEIARVVADIQNQINSLSLEYQVEPISNEFGDNSLIGISQKKLTETVNTIYNLLEEALGRVLRGFTWTVTPTYIYGEWPTSVNVSASPVNLGDVFEHVKLKVNGEVVDHVDEETSTYSFDIPLQQSVNIRLEAQILGVPYYREILVNHYDSFWLGAGAAYSDIMDEAHNINISEGSRIAKNITAANGDHIFIIIGEAWQPSFIRADMNGIEIPFTESAVTIDGKNYKVLTSEDTYEAGTYNIDING